MELVIPWHFQSHAARALMVLHIFQCTRAIFTLQNMQHKIVVSLLCFFLLVGGFLLFGCFYFQEVFWSCKDFPLSPLLFSPFFHKFGKKNKVKYSMEALTRAVLFQRQLLKDKVPFYRAACTRRSTTLSLMHSTETFWELQLGQSATPLPSATDTWPKSSGLPFYSQK